jgi:hypothetical protein
LFEQRYLSDLVIFNAIAFVAQFLMLLPLQVNRPTPFILIALFDNVVKVLSVTSTSKQFGKVDAATLKESDTTDIPAPILEILGAVDYSRIDENNMNKIIIGLRQYISDRMHDDISDFKVKGLSPKEESAFRKKNSIPDNAYSVPLGKDNNINRYRIQPRKWCECNNLYRCYV